MAFIREESLTEDETLIGTEESDTFFFDAEGSGVNALFGVGGNNLFNGIGLSPTFVNGGPGSNIFQVGNPAVNLSQPFFERGIFIEDFSANDLIRVSMNGEPLDLRFGRDIEAQQNATRPFDASIIYSGEGSVLLFDTSGDQVWDYTLTFGQDSPFFQSTAADFNVNIRDLPAGPGTHAIELNPIESDLTAVFRFFNEAAGGHFFTPVAQEMQNVHNDLDFFNHEGVGFFAFDTPEADPNAAPVFRFFNEAAGGHFYTPNAEEAQFVRENLGYMRDEGVGFFAYANQETEPEAAPIFRFFNEAAGGHFYTPSQEEAQFVRENLDFMRDEGVGFWAYGEIA